MSGAVAALPTKHALCSLPTYLSIHWPARCTFCSHLLTSAHPSSWPSCSLRLLTAAAPFLTLSPPSCAFSAPTLQPHVCHADALRRPLQLLSCLPSDAVAQCGGTGEVAWFGSWHLPLWERAGVHACGVGRVLVNSGLPLRPTRWAVSQRKGALCGRLEAARGSAQHLSQQSPQRSCECEAKRHSEGRALS